jgi:probable F420-dependent oxidoreductase
VTFPQSEIGADRNAIRKYATAVEGLGYTHLLAYDHVVGADPTVHAPWAGPYDIDTTFHEPFVLFGFLAGITSLELVNGVLILPQRQTALVAKQAAEVDILTGGRFRLGVGIGWNPVEYEALDKDFHNRGKRIEEQIALLRSLWTDRSVTFDGNYEKVTAAGLAPMPIQRPIPLWMGAFADPGLRRVGRIADGWLANTPPGEKLERSVDIINTAAAEAGRDPKTIGLEGRVSWGNAGVSQVVDHVGRWRDSGATHVTVNTMGAGFTDVQQHIDALAASAEALGVEPA